MAQTCGPKDCDPVCYHCVNNYRQRFVFSYSRLLSRTYPPTSRVGILDLAALSFDRLSFSGCFLVGLLWLLVSSSLLAFFVCYWFFLLFMHVCFYLVSMCLCFVCMFLFRFVYFLFYIFVKVY